MEEVIETTGSSAVLVSKDGLGPWQDKEMRGCLSEFVDRNLPVIPVLLSGAPEKPVLPIFLKGFTWVDLRGGLTEEGIDRLQWGITGKRPDGSKPTAASEAQLASAEMSSAPPAVEAPAAVAQEQRPPRALPGLPPPRWRGKRLGAVVTAMVLAILGISTFLAILNYSRSETPPPEPSPSAIESLPDLTGRLAQKKEDVHIVSLEAGYRYSFEGSCDRCAELSLTLWSTDLSHLESMDLTLGNVPQLVYSPTESGTLKLNVRMGSCSISSCSYTVKVSRNVEGIDEMDNSPDPSLPLGPASSP